VHDTVDDDGAALFFDLVLDVRSIRDFDNRFDFVRVLPVTDFAQIHILGLLS